MEKENKLVKKLKRLLRRLGCPRWLHHYGPKKYEFLDHVRALLVRGYCRLSFRRVKELFSLMGIICPKKSALQWTSKKLNASFWQKLLKATSGVAYLTAVDSTGFSRTNPSYHYLKRIDGKMPKVPVKLSVAFDTAKKKFCSAQIRVLPAHDIRDVKALLKRAKPRVVVADKAYDARWVHEFCHNLGMRAVIPVRQWGKPRFKNMSLRMKCAKWFNKRVYHRRELVESGFSALKRKFGASVSSKTVRTIRTEVYGRLACHNLFFWFSRLFGQSRFFNNVKVSDFKTLVVATTLGSDGFGKPINHAGSLFAVEKSQGIKKRISLFYGKKPGEKRNRSHKASNVLRHGALCPISLDRTFR